MIKHILWDLDGTLFETYPALINAFLAALAAHGHYPEPEVVRGLASISISHCVSSLAATYQLTEQEVIQNFRQYYAVIPYFEQPLKPGALDLCSYIQSIHGTNLIVTHRYRRSTTDLLEYHGLTSVITDIIAGDDGFPKKPAPASMIAILARNNVEASEAISIGDREIDILAGAAAGMQTCLLGQRVPQVPPGFQVNDLYELKEFIQQENSNSI